MSRPSLEVADIFRDHGQAWRRAAKGVSGAGHVSLTQLTVMAAIEACRTAALGGHVAACADCSHTHIAYNSCRNRHCPKCQGVAARGWLERRAADLLPVPYYHVVFTLPAPVADIADTNKAVAYDLLFRASAETLLTIANSRLIAADAETVTFRWKDYRVKGRHRQNVMRLAMGEFIRRSLLHVLPRGFHRIRHYGLFASSSRKRNIATIRQLLHAEPPGPEPALDATQAADAPATRTLRQPCPCCGGPMIVIETFDRGQTPRSRAPPVRSAA